jgi:hypothetical protein
MSHLVQLENPVLENLTASNPFLFIPSTFTWFGDPRLAYRSYLFRVQNCIPGQLKVDPCTCAKLIFAVLFTYRTLYCWKARFESNLKSIVCDWKFPILTFFISPAKRVAIAFEIWIQTSRYALLGRENARRLYKTLLFCVLNSIMGQAMIKLLSLHRNKLGLQ